MPNSSLVPGLICYNPDMYTRVLLKLSGEQLSGKFGGGIDADFCTWLAQEVKKVNDAKTQVVIMVGGGNYARGAQLAGKGITPVTADYVGMLATMMNALALADLFNAAGVSTRALSSIEANQVLDQFTDRRAVSHLQKNRVVIVAGGVGRPYFTTDTAAVNLALELQCQVVLKATKVDGVYDKDPAKFPDAVKTDRMSFEQAVSDDQIRVMDKAAMALAMDHRLPIIVFNATQPDAIAKVAQGEAIGTRIGG
jgi:uridylate kinase